MASTLPTPLFSHLPLPPPPWARVLYHGRSHIPSSISHAPCWLLLPPPPMMTDPPGSAVRGRAGNQRQHPPGPLPRMSSPWSSRWRSTLLLAHLLCLLSHPLLLCYIWRMTVTSSRRRRTWLFPLLSHLPCIKLRLYLMSLLRLTMSSGHLGAEPELHLKEHQRHRQSADYPYGHLLNPCYYGNSI